MKRTLLAVLLTMSATVAQSQSMGFKDLVLGQPLAAAGISAKLKCKDSVCRYKAAGAESLAGGKLQYVQVKLIDGRVSSIWLVFHPNDFDSVMDAFATKYPQLECRRRRQFCSYTDPQGNTLAFHPGDVMMTSPADDAAQAQEEAKAKAKGRKDL